MSGMGPHTKAQIFVFEKVHKGLKEIIRIFLQQLSCLSCIINFSLSTRLFPSVYKPSDISSSDINFFKLFLTLLLSSSYSVFVFCFFCLFVCLFFFWPYSQHVANSAVTTLDPSATASQENSQLLIFFYQFYSKKLREMVLCYLQFHQCSLGYVH